MPVPSEPRLLVLHGLRLKGFGEADDIAALAGLDADTVAKHLDSFAADGLAAHRDGPRLSGWTLTGTGRAEQERALAEELAAAGLRDRIDAAYRRFLALNVAMLELCTAWQMLDDTTINDHTDPAHDAAVLERLMSHHEQLLPILTDLEATFDRFATYRARFEDALTRLRGGDDDWFTKPMIDSYHTIWFQLHEDLLTTLGIDRASEAAS